MAGAFAPTELSQTCKHFVDRDVRIRPRSPCATCGQLINDQWVELLYLLNLLRDETDEELDCLVGVLAGRF